MSKTDSGNQQLADAFGPAALESFALSPGGAHIFRAQHEAILRSATAITTCIEAGFVDEAAGERALQARETLTTMVSCVLIHQSLEQSLMRRALSGDPRTRMQIEQFERDGVPVVSELAGLARRYPTPSAILRAPAEFSQGFASVLSKLQERFRGEERELFTAYDRSVRVSAPGGALLVA
jgi:hypothetical protein